MKQKIKFVDLFSGIGAFHSAIKKVFKNSECIATVEIDQHAKETYFKNYIENKKLETLILNNLNDQDVINQLTSKNIFYNLLCAGFPCQPFSKAGTQTGPLHKEGKLFDKVLQVIKVYNENHENPLEIVLLENVAFLANHNNKITWIKMKSELKQLGYFFPDDQNNLDIIISPTNLKIPQNRKRLFLLAFHKKFLLKNNIEKNQIIFNAKKINNITLEKKSNLNALDYLSKVNLSKEEIDSNILEKEKIKILEVWEEFVKVTSLKNKTLGFPIWLDFFEMEDKVKYKENFQKWKLEFYLKNQEFYLKNKNHIDKWWSEYKEFLIIKKTYRKFEWNSSNKLSKIDEGIIQFRHSGIRVKKPDFFPALVKMSSKPIIWDKNYSNYRYIDIKEALHLQSFDYKKFIFPKAFSNEEPFKRVGNSINIKVIEKILLENKNIIEKIMSVDNYGY